MTEDERELYTYQLAVTFDRPVSWFTILGYCKDGKQLTEAKVTVPTPKEVSSG